MAQLRLKKEIQNLKFNTFGVRGIQKKCPGTSIGGNHFFFLNMRSDMKYSETKSQFSSTPLAIPNLANCRALLYCRCVRTWGGFWLGSPGPIELIARRRLVIQAPPAQERKVYSYLTVRSACSLKSL